MALAVLGRNEPELHSTAGNLSDFTLFAGGSYEVSEWLRKGRWEVEGLEGLGKLGLPVG
jgi:hypothetical protein